MTLKKRLPDIWYPRLWAAWALASATSFAVLETNALVVQPRSGRDSLTRNLQWLFCRSRPRRRISMAAWCAFSVWFLFHTWLSYVEDPNV